MKRKFKKAILRKARKSIDVMADLMKANQRSFSTIERWCVVSKLNNNLDNEKSITVLVNGLSISESEIFE